MADFNEGVIAEFRENDGVVGGMFEGLSMVLVHNVGAKSGQARVTPLAYYDDGDSYAIFASKAGAPENPGWYYNLKANPKTKIELGSETIDVVASEVTGADRDRIYDAQKALRPQFAEYEQKTDRVIPVIVLTPAG
jgi:deazaflavin-dependent oxidoreductase (nitroreductase family)